MLRASPCLSSLPLPVRLAQRHPQDILGRGYARQARNLECLRRAGLEQGRFGVKRAELFSSYDSGN